MHVPKHMMPVDPNMTGLSWYELINHLLATYPPEVLAMEACVWIYADTDCYEGCHPIYDVNPYDGDAPIGVGNRISLDIA